MTKLPYDELDLFNKEDFHEFVGETLILSTMVYEYLSGAERTRSLIITKKRIYLLQKEMILHAIDIGWIQGIVRSQQFPELVILVIPEQDDLRLATTTDERCEAIMQALAYIFTMFIRRDLPCFKLKESSLKMAGEMKEVKIKRRRLEGDLGIPPLLKGKTAEMIKYVEPEEEETKEKTLYKGIQEKVSLNKVFFKEKLAEGTTFKSYICKVDLNPGICFVYQRTAFTGVGLDKHQNCQFIVSLLYAIQTQHKIFVIYEYLRHRQHINQQYHGCTDYSEVNIVFSAESYVIPSNMQNNITFGQQKVKWKEFRYLQHCDELERFVYTAPEALVQPKRIFTTDIYSIGVLLFELVYSVAPFLHRQPEMILKFKMANRILFPKYMHITGMSVLLQDFVFKCTQPDPAKRFKNYDELKRHPWIN